MFQGDKKSYFNSSKTEGHIAIHVMHVLADGMRQNHSLQTIFRKKL